MTLHPENQCPACSAPGNFFPQPAPPIYIYTEHDSIWYRIFFWLVGVNCSGCVPFQLPGKVNSLPAKPRPVWQKLCPVQSLGSGNAALPITLWWGRAWEMWAWAQSCPMRLHLVKKSAGAAASITSPSAKGVAMWFPNRPASPYGDVCAWTGQEACV